MLETGSAFLAWLFLPAVFLEAGKREPGAICCSLARLGSEPSRTAGLLGKWGARDLQSLLAHAAPLHPTLAESDEE
jgi:hypothetical protein